MASRSRVARFYWGRDVLPARKADCKERLGINYSGCFYRFRNGVAGGMICFRFLCSSEFDSKQYGGWLVWLLAGSMNKVDRSCVPEIEALFASSFNIRVKRFDEEGW